MNDVKVYVPVKASFDSEGQMLPRELIWEDGRKYKIDRVLDIPASGSCQGWKCLLF